MSYLKSGRTWAMASFAVFIVGLMSGWTLWDQQTDQYRYYKLGTEA